MGWIKTKNISRYCPFKWGTFKGYRCGNFYVPSGEMCSQMFPCRGAWIGRWLYPPTKPLRITSVDNRSRTKDNLWKNMIGPWYLQLDMVKLKTENIGKGYVLKVPLREVIS
jgi:hypothetical protein